MLAILISNFSLYAQNKNAVNSIGIIAGLTQYNGDMGQGFYHGTTKAFGGLGYSRYINGHFDFVFNATIGRWGYEEEKKRKFDTRMMQANIHFRVKLINSDEHKLVPYIFAGAGIADYSDYSLKTATDVKIDNPDGNGTDVFIPYGLGLQFQLTEKFNLSFQETFGYTDHDTRDGEERQNNESFLLHTIGFSFNFGGEKDADKDGVKDSKDNCPNTPVGIKVDEKGCPLDKDGDLVYDYQDSCKEVKGSIALHGCPDKDGDGIGDKEDKCPDEAGPVATNGCPDKDGDGVVDNQDHCPDVKGSQVNNGCPDRDEDGVADVDDSCPDQKGTELMHGCADTDGDGIADNTDKCPDEKGLASNNGCPEIKANTQFGSLLFETARFNIKPSHYSTLNKVVKILKENPSYKLKIEGHTDNKGKDDINVSISQKRADAAMNYLSKKGIDSRRMEAKGFGNTQPIESNDTETGRAKNRRVELKVIQ